MFQCDFNHSQSSSKNSKNKKPNYKSSKNILKHHPSKPVSINTPLPTPPIAQITSSNRPKTAFKSHLPPKPRPKSSYSSKFLQTSRLQQEFYSSPSPFTSSHVFYADRFPRFPRFNLPQSPPRLQPQTSVLFPIPTPRPLNTDLQTPLLQTKLPISLNLSPKFNIKEKKQTKGNTFFGNILSKFKRKEEETKIKQIVNLDVRGNKDLEEDWDRQSEKRKLEVKEEQMEPRVWKTEDKQW